MQSKARGSFPTERIKLVINTDPRAFKKGTLASPDVHFQVTILYSLLHIRAMIPDLSLSQVIISLTFVWFIKQINHWSGNDFPIRFGMV